MKYVITDKQLKNICFEYLDYLFKDIYEVPLKGQPSNRFFKRGNQIVLQLYGNEPWIDSRIWTKFFDMFEFDYDKIQEILKQWLEKKFEIKNLNFPSPKEGWSISL